MQPRWDTEWAKETKEIHRTEPKLPPSLSSPLSTIPFVAFAILEVPGNRCLAIEWWLVLRDQTAKNTNSCARKHHYSRMHRTLKQRGNGVKWNSKVSSTKRIMKMKANSRMPVLVVRPSARHPHEMQSQPSVTNPFWKTWQGSVMYRHIEDPTCSCRTNPQSIHTRPATGDRPRKKDVGKKWKEKKMKVVI